MLLPQRSEYCCVQSFLSQRDVRDREFADLQVGKRFNARWVGWGKRNIGVPTSPPKNIRLQPHLTIARSAHQDTASKVNVTLDIWKKFTASFLAECRA